MTNSETPVYLTLQLRAGEEAGPEMIDLLARQLLSEIGELDVESAALTTSGPAPEGAKSAELITLGSLAVVVLPVIAPKVIDLLQSWSMRAENRTVKIKAQAGDRSIEVEYSPAAMSAADLKRLVNTLSGAIPPAGATPPAEKS